MFCDGRCKFGVIVDRLLGISGVWVGREVVDAVMAFRLCHILDLVSGVSKDVGVVIEEYWESFGDFVENLGSLSKLKKGILGIGVLLWRSILRIRRA